MQCILIHSRYFVTDSMWLIESIVSKLVQNYNLSFVETWGCWLVYSTQIYLSFCLDVNCAVINTDQKEDQMNVKVLRLSQKYKTQ